MESVHVFDALGDANRRAMLERLLKSSGQSVSDLARPLGLSRQAADKHLRILMAAELVVSRKVGRARRHYLNPMTIRRAGAWLKRFEKARLRDLLAE